MVCIFFFFKQKTAYEIRPCDWSSDVCSSDLARPSRVARRTTSRCNRRSPPSPRRTAQAAGQPREPRDVGSSGLPAAVAHGELALELEEIRDDPVGDGGRDF